MFVIIIVTITIRLMLLLMLLITIIIITVPLHLTTIQRLLKRLIILYQQRLMIPHQPLIYRLLYKV